MKHRSDYSFLKMVFPVKAVPGTQSPVMEFTEMPPPGKVSPEMAAPGTESPMMMSPKKVSTGTKPPMIFPEMIFPQVSAAPFRQVRTGLRRRQTIWRTV